MSNGGGMSYLLACDCQSASQRWGVCSGAYLYPLEDCQPVRPVPLIAFHGTADPIVPLREDLPGLSIFHSPLSRLDGAYAAKNGCDSSPEALQNQGSVNGVRYGDCEADADVVFYTIKGGGHTWPGGEPLPEWLTGLTSMDIDATRLMWAVFHSTSIRAVKSPVCLTA